MSLPNRGRRSIRLQGYDYTQGGAYFITVCTHNKEHIFGEVRNGEMNLYEQGRIIEEEWSNTAIRRPDVKLDQFVIMPNHFHGIIWINAERWGTARCAPTAQQFGKAVCGSLPVIIR